MKKLFVILFLLLFVVILPAVVNTTTSSKGYLKDQTGGWWRGATQHFPRQIITIDYVTGSCTSITLIAGVRFTNEGGLINTVTYRVPIISAAGVASYDPITITAAGSYVFTVGVNQAADDIDILVVYADGTNATVNINHSADIRN